MKKLTRSVLHTIIERARRDPEFAAALRIELETLGPLDRRFSKLCARDGMRDIGQELPQSLRDVKGGLHGAVHLVPVAHKDLDAGD